MQTSGLVLIHWVARALGTIGRTLLALLLALGFQPVAGLTSAAPAPLAPQNGCSLLVNNTNDSGAGSLRDAVNCAVDGDTVTFDAGVAGLVISLTTGEIPVNYSITIDGSGAPGVKVDAGLNSRIFNVQPSGPVTLTALILQHGSAAGGGAVVAGLAPLILNQVSVYSSTAPSGSGGGLSTVGPLTITGGVFQNNTCTDTFCDGGAMRVISALVLSGTAFISNTSDFAGGGVVTAGDAVFTNSWFERNGCTGSSCQGGGLKASAPLTITGSTFIENSGLGSGGGLYAEADATVSASQFISNTSGSYGAGLYANTVLTLTSATFRGNIAEDGGGGAYTENLGVISGGSFEGNSCTLFYCLGGALYASYELVVTGTQFLTNTSVAAAGAIYGYGPMTLTDALIQNNLCSDPDCAGGGVYADASAEFSGTAFLTNTSTIHGGGAYVVGRATVTGGHFENNICTQGNCLGGGLWSDQAVMTDTDFISNTSAVLGGGIFATNGVTLTGGQIERNRCTATFCLGGGLGTNAAATLLNVMVLTNTSEGNGGGVYAVGAVTLTNGLFQSNLCADSACYGGGLYTNATLVATESEFISNTSRASAGGVYAFGAVSLTDGLFQGNSCTVSLCQGGGLLGNGTVLATATEFISNTSQGNGGGAFATDVTQLTGGRFERNTCLGSGCQGGGLYAFYNLILTDTQFLTNTSRGSGGGLLANSALTLTGGLFYNNSCGGIGCFGGGLTSIGPATLLDTTILSNTSRGSGGGAMAGDALALTNSLFQDNRCTDNSCTGGGLFAGTTLVAVDTDFISNTSASNGGGARAFDAVTLTNGVFQGNVCQSGFCWGGGLYAGGSVSVTNTDFLSNTSQSGAGGLFSFGAVTASGVRLAGNACLAASCSAGGLYSSGNLTLTDAEVIANTSVSNGGGLVAQNTAVITGSLLAGNACTGDDEDCLGGAIYLEDGELIITNTSFVTNTSVGNGGAIYTEDKLTLTGTYFQGNACADDTCRGGAVGSSRTMLVQRSAFVGNAAGGVGGALAIWRNGTLTLVNSTLSGNQADLAGGGLFAADTSHADLLNVTIADNQAGIGSGLYTEVLTRVGVTNTVITGSGPSVCGGQIDFGTHNLEWAGGSCGLVGPAAGFTTSNPLLAPLAFNAPGQTPTHALQEGSPARDAGDAVTCAGPLVNNLDQRGVTRPIDSDLTVGAVCDIGAYEAPAAAEPPPPADEFILYIPLVFGPPVG